MIYWAVLMTRCSCFLCAVQLAYRTVGQDTHYCAAVEVFQQRSGEFVSLQHSQEEETLLDLLIM